MDKNLCAMTPPMGWNSWDCYGNAVTEEILRKLGFFEVQLKLEGGVFMKKCRFKSQAIGGAIAIKEWLLAGRPCSKTALADIIL